MHIAFVGEPVSHQPTRCCRYGGLIGADAYHPLPSPAEQPSSARSHAYAPPSVFAQGHTQPEIARDLGVSRQDASGWHVRFEQGGVCAFSRGPLTIR